MNSYEKEKRAVIISLVVFLLYFMMLVSFLLFGIEFSNKFVLLFAAITILVMIISEMVSRDKK